MFVYGGDAHWKQLALYSQSGGFARLEVGSSLSQPCLAAQEFRGGIGLVLDFPCLRAFRFLGGRTFSHSFGVGRFSACLQVHVAFALDIA